MKVELHCHTSRYSGCAISSPRELMRRFIKFGYDAVFLTEHDAVWSDHELEELGEDFPQLRIFPGVELSIGWHHLLVLGTNDVRYLQAADEREAVAKAQAEGHLTILAHPFRWQGAAEMLERGPLPEAIEYRTSNHDADEAEAARAAARRLGLALVNAGDIHSAAVLNRFWIETHRPLERAGDIRDIVLSGAYVNRPG
jgi:hypothetical protein